MSSVLHLLGAGSAAYDLRHVMQQLRVALVAAPVRSPLRKRTPAVHLDEGHRMPISTARGTRPYPTRLAPA